MICPKCNKEIEDGSKFCEFCGAKIDEVQESAFQEAPKQEQVAETVSRTPEPEPQVQVNAASAPIIQSIFNGKITFLSSIFTFYKENYACVENDNLMLCESQSAAGVAPQKSNYYQIPLSDISSASNSIGIKWGALLLAIITTALGFGMVSKIVALGIALIVIGIFMIINSFVMELHIGTTTDQIINCEATNFQKSKIANITNEIKNIAAQNNNQ